MRIDFHVWQKILSELVLHRQMQLVRLVKVRIGHRMPLIPTLNVICILHFIITINQFNIDPNTKLVAHFFEVSAFLSSSLV